MEHDSALSFHHYDHNYAFPDAFQYILDTSQLVDFNDIGSLDNNNLEDHPHEPPLKTTSHPTVDDSFFDIDVHNFLFQGQDGTQNETAHPDHATEDPLLGHDLTIEQGENEGFFTDSTDFLSRPIEVEQGGMGQNINNLDWAVDILNGPIEAPQVEMGKNMNDLDLASNFLDDPIDLALGDENMNDLHQAIDFLDGSIDVAQGEMVENMNNLDQEHTKALTVWPPQPVPFSCSCCQVLREIVHSDGTYISKLEIHGRVGIIYHGILEMKSINDGLPVTNPQMVDFCLRSMEDVRRFLMQYCLDRNAAGFVMMQDSLFPFYSTLCVGLDLNTLEIMPPPHTETGISEISPLVAESSPVVPSRPSLSTQRKRTRRLRRSHLDSYFHLPITVASRKLGICTTAIKKICRNFGLKRWPYRKIRKVQNKIVRLEEGLRNKNEEESAGDGVQIETLKQERERIINSLMDRGLRNQSS